MKAGGKRREGGGEGGVKSSRLGVDRLTHACLAGRPC